MSFSVTRKRAVAFASVLAISSAAPARAQTTDADPGSATATSQGLVAPTAPTTAPDDPKVEKARQEAKRAELTPIVPSPKDVTKPAFQLYAETDLPLLGIGIVMAATRLVRTQPAYCAPLCDKTTLNAVDATTAGFYDATWAIASDVGLYGLMGLAAVGLAIDEGFLPALNDAVVVAESALSAVAVSSLATLAAGRPRPFLYGENAPLDVRNSADAGLSFVSSHASVTFAIAVSTYITERRLHPGPGVVFPAVVLASGLVVASFVATARVEAGKHFITDSIAGAVVGTSVGVLIPALHKSPVQVVPNVTSREGTINLVGVF
jgi:membrane-associated phospholipid phosphatase